MELSKVQQEVYQEGKRCVSGICGRKSKRNGTEISRGSMRRTVASILQLRHAWCGFGPGA